MIKKSKRKILAIAALSTVAAGTAAFAVACGSTTSKFDQANTKTVRLASTFSVNGLQERAINEIIKKYNSLYQAGGELANDNENFLPVEYISLTDGYSGGARTTLQKVAGKDTTNLYNIILNYPGLVAQLATYGMNLPLEDNGQTLLGNYETAFTTGNAVGGVDAKNVNILPFGVSSVVSGINGPLFAYFITEALKAGATIKAEDKAWFESTILTVRNTDETQFKFIRDGQADATGGAWGSIEEADKGIWSNYVFTKAMFDNAKDLVDFGSKVVNSFSNAKDGQKNRTNQRGVIGIDSLMNFISMYLYADNNAEEAGFLLDRENSSLGFINYNNVFDTSSTQYAKFKKFYEEVLRPGINSGAIWIGGKSGDYGSNIFKEHKLALSLGSTAGYKFNFVEGSFFYRFNVGDKTVSYTTTELLPITLPATANTSTSANSSGGDYNSITYNGHVNNYYPSTKERATDFTVDKQRFYLQSANTDTDAKVTEKQSTSGFIVFETDIATDKLEEFKNETGVTELGDFYQDSTGKAVTKKGYFVVSENKVPSDTLYEKYKIEKFITLEANNKIKAYALRTFKNLWTDKDGTKDRNGTQFTTAEGVSALKEKISTKGFFIIESTIDTSKKDTVLKMENVSLIGPVTTASGNIKTNLYFVASEDKLTPSTLITKYGVPGYFNSFTVNSASTGSTTAPADTTQKQLLATLRVTNQHNNPLFSSTTAVAEDKSVTYDGRKTGYYLISSGAEVDAKIKEVLAKSTAAKSVFIVIPTTDTSAFETKMAGQFEKVGLVHDRTVKNESTEKILYYLDSSKFSLVDGASTTLQEEELITLMAPSKFQEGNKVGLVYQQGPSVIGIHSNEIGNAATRKFLKWLASSNKYTWTINQRDIEASPQEYFLQAASYVIPYKGFTTSSTVQSLMERQNPYVKATFEAFKKAVENNGVSYRIFSESIDALSDRFRNDLETTISNAKAGGIQEFDKFLESFRIQFKQG
ncbi:putative lipoprotein [Mycoplasma testudineum]|uniref:Putative lipoprotein n=1 Tax=Mycoplasma testudineum TaxID=244584 RepID=A0A4V3C2V8_9MOLU|nr:P80 family lipoprotein [Mycoplasma testudineum]OYD26743.1 hypothetical protein CG473_02195 [Mycoplasma testudineum]TDO19879.1 putative lipoprotein [Mycoplasma testudineum]